MNASTRRWTLLVQMALLLIAAGVFVVRGPAHAHTAGDLATPFVAASRYDHGLDPYDMHNFEQDWVKAGIAQDAIKNNGSLQPVYPPPALLVLAPLSLLKWSLARPIYISACTALYLSILFYMLRDIKADETLLGWPRTLFLGFGLALSPLLTGISKGNLSILALLLAVAAVLLAERRYPLAAGLALGLACSLKPTVGASFLLYYLLVRQWRVIAVSCTSVLALAAVSLHHLQTTAPLWRRHYEQNVAFFLGPNGENKWHGPALSRFDLLDLQLPLYEFTHNVRWSSLLTYAVFMALACLWAIPTWRSVAKEGDWERDFLWASVAAISLLCLLPVYQRNYNAGAILLAVAWAAQHPGRRSAKWIGLLSLTALFPFQAYFRGWVYPHLSTGFTQNVFWRGLVMPQLTWAILGITGMLLIVMWGDSNADRRALPWRALPSGELERDGFTPPHERAPLRQFARDSRVWASSRLFPGLRASTAPSDPRMPRQASSGLTAAASAPPSAASTVAVAPPSRAMLRASLWGMLVLIGSFTFLDYWGYAAEWRAHPAMYDILAQGQGQAPAQYRVGIVLLAKALRGVTHLGYRHFFALFDFACAVAATLLLRTLLLRSHAFQAAKESSRWLRIAFFLGLLSFYLSWTVWYQRPETLPSALFLAASLYLLCRVRSQALAVAGLLLLVTLQGAVRSDVATLFHLGLFLYVLVRGAHGFVLARGTLLVTSFFGFAVPTGMLWFFVHRVFPHATYGDTKVVQLVYNLSPFNSVAFLLFIVPIAYTYRRAWVERLSLTGPQSALLLGSLLFLGSWACLGRVREVRIFVPFAMALLPLSANLAGDAIDRSLPEG